MSRPALQSLENKVFEFSLFLSLCFSASVSVSIYVSLSVSLPLPICLCLSLSFCLSVCLIVSVSATASCLCLCLSLPVCLPLPPPELWFFWPPRLSHSSRALTFLAPSTFTQLLSSDFFGPVCSSLVCLLAERKSLRKRLYSSCGMLRPYNVLCCVVFVHKYLAVVREESGHRVEPTLNIPRPAFIFITSDRNHSHCCSVRVIFK